MQPTTKTCTKCGQAKALDCYRLAKRGKYGRDSVCKECASAAAKAYYAAVSAAFDESVIPATKVCTSCGVTKVASEFPLCRGRKDGLGGNCKECRKKYTHSKRAADQQRVW